MTGKKVDLVVNKDVKKSARVIKKAKSTHPPTATMVNVAIRTLKERGGSSLPAIKKYLASNYKVDVDKLAPFIKKYLRNAVGAGKLIQTKGKGATGSFKLPAKGKISPKDVKPNASKKTAAKAQKAVKNSKQGGSTKGRKEKSTKKPAKVIKTKTPKAKKVVKSA